jgi:hypothetical protein
MTALPEKRKTKGRYLLEPRQEDKSPWTHCLSEFTLAKISLMTKREE